MTDVSREDLLERYGRWYGDERFAIAFTSTIEGEDAKRVTTQGWDQTKPLSSGDFGASFVAGRGTTRNPVIVLRPSNLVVLECDTEDDLLRIEALGLPVTITVRSSKPYKRHFYYRPPADLERLAAVAFRFESGKLTADSGRYFLAPPSIHPSGAIYAFLPDLGPDDVDIAELPEDIYRMLLDSATRETAEQRERIHVDPEAKVVAGQRGDSIFRYACMLRRWGLNYQQILDAALQWNDDRCLPPIERSRVEMQVDGAFKKRGDQEIQRALANPLPDDEPASEPESPLGSWQPINLADPEHKIPPEPPAVAGLLYAARRHVISGPPEAAKTLIAYHLLLEALRDGDKVSIIDFEMGSVAAWRLLHDLGATDDEIQQIHYVEPHQPPTPDALQAIIDHGTRYALIDAAIGAYDTTGLDDNARKDVEEFARLWIRPLWKAGVATILLDHVTKNAETRGRYAIGSERKGGQTDIHLGFEALKQISRGGSGLVKVTVHKDRPAFLHRPTAATLELNSSPHDNAITVDIHTTQTAADDEPWRPTFQMERVSRYLENHSEPVSRTNVETNVKGHSAKTLRQAIDALVEDGYAVEIPGARGARNVAIIRPYRQQNNPTPSTPSHPVPPRPDGVISTPSAAVPPTGTRTGSDDPDHHDPVPDHTHLTLEPDW